MNMATKTKAPQKPVTLESKVELYLEKKAAATKLASEIDGLKEQIEDAIRQEKRQFVDGAIQLETGTIKQVNGAPSLVWFSSGKSLKPAEREKLATVFPGQYIKADLNVKLIAESGTNEVAAIMAQHGLELMETTNIQIKGL